jgi:DNA-binding NarL/FixJ family response regulator
MIGILIVAGIRLYREGLAHLLDNEADMIVRGLYANGRETLPILPLAGADVILLDMAVPEGYQTARVVREMTPVIPLVAIGIADSDAEVIACAEAGATAYVTREGSVAELVAAVRSAARGELICSPRVAGTLVRRVATLAGERQAVGQTARLTQREREIASLIGHLSNKEIATRLRIEVATVKNHVHNLLEKLNAHSRLEVSHVLANPERPDSTALNSPTPLVHRG